MPGTHVAIRTRTEWASDANAVKILDQDSTGPNVSLLHATQPEQRYTEEDQTDPAGRWRTIVTGDVYTIQRAATANWATFTTVFQLDGSGWLVPDDVIFGIGTSRDTAIINRSTINAADGEITNVIVGTSDHQGTAANSLIISNITASGDIQVLVNNGGNSLEALLIDASVPSWHLGYALTGDGSVYVGTGNSFDVYINKVKEIDYATGALAFQQATTISTTVSPLVLTTASGGEVVVNDAQIDINFRIESDNIANMFVVDAGVDSIGIGTATLTANTPLYVNPPTRTLGVGVSGNVMSIEGAFTEAASGAHSFINGLNIDPPTVTGQGATTTIATTLRLAAAPTIGASNYTLLVDAGNARFDAQIFLGVTAGANVTAAGSMIAAGGVAIGADALNNLIDDASGGTGSTALFIGNAQILVDGVSMANDIDITATSAGVARSINFDIAVGAGGAANNQLFHRFYLDGVAEAGLSGETDGSSGVTAATQVWKIPYRDSGINVAEPAALNVEVLGGLRVEAGDDTNRIYFRANAAWHYINQTAGLSITAEERVDPWTGRRWETGDMALVKMHKAYGDGAADFLPYPLEEGLREALLKLLDVDREFRAQVVEKLARA